MKSLPLIIGVLIVCGAGAPSTAAPAPAAAKQESPEAKAKAKAVKEARTRRFTQYLEDNSRVITVYDRSGKVVTTLGKPALYSVAVFSPDGKRIAVTRSELADMENESEDLWVIDVATGQETRITTSAKSEWVSAVVWSPDGTQLAYVTVRAGVEGLYRRAANGRGAEELLYKHGGFGMDLSDWSLDGRLFAFSLSDLSGGSLFVLPLEGERKARLVFHTDEQRVYGARFSPDSRFVSYLMREKASVMNSRGEIFVRSLDPASHAGPWQISNGNAGTAFWRRDGKQLYHMGLDRSVMVAEVQTSPAFTFTKPKVLFRAAGVVPDRISSISRDGERFIALSPAKGPKLQQITIFDRQGKVLKKVGEPGLYSELAFSDDGRRLAVMKNDISTGLENVWVIDVATGKGTQLTNDALFKVNPFWTHDGRYVIYSTYRIPNMGIFRRAADGTGPEELLYEYSAGAFMTATDISRDGKLLIGESGGVILAVPLTGADARGREAIEYVRSEFDTSLGRLSPDGKLMAFSSDEIQAERGEIYVRPFDVTKPARDGDTKWQISKQGANDMLLWRGDGAEIFFGGLNLENHDFLVMAADVSTSPAFHAGAPKLLFKVPGPVSTGAGIGNAGLANVSRDGQQFVFAINVPVGAPPR